MTNCKDPLVFSTVGHKVRKKQGNLFGMDLRVLTPLIEVRRFAARIKTR
jgi:hypothetical protein